MTFWTDRDVNCNKTAMQDFDVFFVHLSSVFQHPLCSFPSFFFSENDETGVMDSLLEALQSGAAFRDRRKRAPRPRGESFILSLHQHTNKDSHIKPALHIVLVGNVLIPVRCLKITVSMSPNLPTGCICFLSYF